jgi:hypothetical protein
MTCPTDYQLQTQQALLETVADLATALERVIALHAKVLPAQGGTAVCAECGQGRWHNRLCGTLALIADTLNLRYGEPSHLSATAQSGQVRSGYAAVAELENRRLEALRRFQLWFESAGPVPDPQRAGSAQRDSGVRSGQAQHPQAGGDAYLPPGSVVGPE